MYIDLTIDIVVMAAKAGGASTVAYYSDFAPAGQALDLYVAEASRAIVLYHHAAYDDPVLGERHRLHQMVYPGNPHERIILVGQLRAAPPGIPVGHVEVSRAQLHLKGIPVDER